MQKTNLQVTFAMRAPIAKQAGVVAVELALVSVLFFTLVFGIIELCRIMYLYNTLADVTRSVATAAAKVDFRTTNTGEIDLIRQKAVFRDSPGGLLFGDPITDQSIRIDYLAITSGTMTPLSSGSLPGCPARNRQNCLENQYGASCIRLVRARVCTSSSGACEPVQYQMLFPLVNLNVTLPISSTIVQAETLGYTAGDPLCD